MSTLIIAEAGVNHNGSLDMALALVDAAAGAGADIVKFQTFKSASVIAASAPKAEYQKGTTGAVESQLDMVRKLELSEDAHRHLEARCRERKIEFLSTPFDLESAAFLVRDMGIRRMKTPSGEVTNAPYVLALARYRLPIILSTGMATLADIEIALGVIAFGLLDLPVAPSPAAFAEAYASPEGQAALARHVELLHCTTEYPAAFEDTNLKAMDTMAVAFGLPVGLSDHTPGIVAPIAAVARGATIIEKHFTLDRTLPGPDHAASLEPGELAAMIDGIRKTEAAIGNGRKIYGAAEARNRPIARRSLIAARAVRKGEVWTGENLTCKRPGTGLSPLLYWEFLGKPADRDYAADELVGVEKA